MAIFSLNRICFFPHLSVFHVAFASVCLSLRSAVAFVGEWCLPICNSVVPLDCAHGFVS